MKNSKSNEKIQSWWHFQVRLNYIIFVINNIIRRATNKTPWFVMIILNLLPLDKKNRRGKKYIVWPSQNGSQRMKIFSWKQYRKSSLPFAGGDEILRSSTPVTELYNKENSTSLIKIKGNGMHHIQIYLNISKHKLI